MIKKRLQRTAVLISYKGSSFFGWQRQKNKSSVQAVIEDTLTLLFQRETRICGAGRTDAGVHAIGQVAHFSRPISFQPDKLKHSLNSLLTPEIRILDIVDVSEDFHAQYSAIGKTYVSIINTDKVLSPFLNGYCYHLPDIGDIELIKTALEMLSGEHTFRYFTTYAAISGGLVRKIHKTALIKKNGLLFIGLTADGFLRYMVRSIIGTLIKISKGKISLEEFKLAMNGEKISPLPASLKIGPEGLYMLKVFYTNDPFIDPDKFYANCKLLWPFMMEVDLCQLLASDLIL